MSEPSFKPQLPEFGDPRVQLVYNMLCDDDSYATEGDEHWEGAIARRIVAALWNTRAQPEPAAHPELPAPGSPAGRRFLGLIAALKERYPDPEPWSARAYEGRFLAWLDSLLAARQAEPVQRPVAWEWFSQDGQHHLTLTEPADYELPLQVTALYAAPPAQADAIKGEAAKIARHQSKTWDDIENAKWYQPEPAQESPTQPRSDKQE